MKTIQKTIIWIIFLIFAIVQIGYATNPGDENWKSFIYDKEAWEGGPVERIITDGEEIFVAGNIGTRFYDHKVFNGLAELKGSRWVPLGTGNTAGVRGYFPSIRDIVKNDEILYVGGLFEYAGNSKVCNLAQWNTNTQKWSPIGSGMKGYVASLALKDNFLFVGGSFDTLKSGNNTIVSKNIAKWTGNSWSSLNNGVNGEVNSIFVNGNDVYVVGEFDTVGNIRANNIGIWDDDTGTWSSFDTLGPVGEVSTVCKIGSNVYFAGIFDQVNTAGGVINSQNIVSWNGSTWDSLGNGINGNILQMISDGSNLYVVGYFTKTIDDTLVCKNIAKWDGNDWSIFGSGANEAIYTISLKGDSILIGGLFSFTGDELAENIGLWYETPPTSDDSLNDDEPRNSGTSEAESIVLKAFPNPANKQISFDFTIEQKGNVNLLLFDIMGNQVAEIINKEYDAGEHRLTWDSSEISSGNYICKISQGEKFVIYKIKIAK